MKSTLMLSVRLAVVAVISLILFTGCKKDDENTVKDIDGNVYRTLVIGGNTWMVENLRTTKFRDGSGISLATDNTEWAGQSTAAYCWPENNQANKATMGAFYNGYAVFDTRGLCPAGWAIPSDEDWIDLELELGLPQAQAYLDDVRGEDENIGGKMKATVNWENPNLGANNSSGFSAYGTGHRYPSGEFNYYRQWTGYLSTTPATTQGNYWMRYLGYDIKGIDRHERSRQYGFSVRCLKD